MQYHKYYIQSFFYYREQNNFEDMNDKLRSNQSGKINRSILTLDEFRNSETRKISTATGELSSLLRDISIAAKRINVEVNKAGLVDIFGNIGIRNTHGEDITKLDDYANQEFINVLKRGSSCAGVASEEMESILIFEDDASMSSKYICMFDPLDGSSNIDVNISIGTIFSIYKRISPVGKAAKKVDFLQKGIQQVAAGYIVYGSSTMLVYATKRGVNGFTLDPSIGEFCMSHPNIQCPENGHIYSLNTGYHYCYSSGIRNYIQNYQIRNRISGYSYSHRYTGSMIADLHRTIIKGGIFLYPAVVGKPKGKLRLMYECNPFAYIIEMAGGRATNGKERILEIIPTKVHQPTPFFAGSRLMIDELEAALLVKKSNGTK